MPANNYIKYIAEAYGSSDLHPLCLCPTCKRPLYSKSTARSHFVREHGYGSFDKNTSSALKGSMLMAFAQMETLLADHEDTMYHDTEVRP